MIEVSKPMDPQLQRILTKHQRKAAEAQQRFDETIERIKKLDNGPILDKMKEEIEDFKKKLNQLTSL